MRTLLFIYHFLFLFFCLPYSLKAQETDIPDSLLGIKYYEKINYADPDTMFYYAEKAAFHLKNSKNWEKITECHLFMATAKHWQGAFLESMDYTEKLLSLAQQHFGTSSMIYTDGLTIAAFNHSAFGAYEQSIAHYEKAIQLHKQEEINPIVLSSYYENKGIVHEEFGEYDSSIDCLENALRLGPNDLSSTYKNLANAYLQKEHYKKAKVNYFKSLDLLKNTATKYDAQKKLDAYQGLSKIHLIEEKNDSVRYCIQQLNKTREKFKGDFIADYHRFEILAQLYHKIQETQKAEQAYEEAIQSAQEEFKDFERHYEIALMMEQKAAFLHQNKQLQAALEVYQQALIQNTITFENKDWTQLPLLNQFQNDAYGLDILTGKTAVLYDLYQKKGKNLDYLQAAFETSQLASNLIFQIRREYKAEGSKLFLSEKVVPFYELAIEIALVLYETQQDRSYQAQAFQFSEANKALLLLESIQQNEARRSAQLPTKWTAREKELKLQMAFYKKKIEEEKQKKTANLSPELSTWESNLFNLNETYQSLLDTLKQNFPDFRQQSEQIDLATLDAVQGTLENSNSSILQIFVGEQSIFLFLIQANKISVHQIKEIEKIKTAVQRLLQVINRPPKSQSFEKDFQIFTQEAQFLYNKLLADILTQNTEDTPQLNIIPDGFLSFLPFEIVLAQAPQLDRIDFSPNNLAYLFKSYVIHYSYSASLMTFSNYNAKENKRSDFVGFAPSFEKKDHTETRTCLENDLYALRCNQKETQTIQQIMEGQSFVADASTKSTFLETAHEAGILHLATHVCMNVDAPKTSKIFFTDGYLTAYDLTNLELNNQLTVLSACNTGVGKLLNGEGVLSLAREFTLAGSPSTLTSLWAIDDCSTADIMTNYYQNLKHHQHKDAALRQAKLSFLQKADRELAHPYYWAAFLQFGEVSPLEIPRNWTLEFLLAMGLLGLGFWSWRRYG